MHTYKAFRLFSNWSADVKTTSVRSRDLDYRWMSDCADDHLVRRIGRFITMGNNNSNEHDAGCFHECIMFCISIRWVSVFIMLNLERRRAVSAIHIPTIRVTVEDTGLPEGRHIRYRPIGPVTALAYGTAKLNIVVKTVRPKANNNRILNPLSPVVTMYTA
jgi:hypothetical protein